MLTEIKPFFSTRIAESIPKQLQTFRGISQEQGSWLRCIDLNRRLMPSLAPLSYDLFADTQESGYYPFLQSWKAFQKIQRYTDGEAFYLCFPAAFQFGIYAKSGWYDARLFPTWRKAYLHDQHVTELGGEIGPLRYSSSVFDEKIRNTYTVYNLRANNGQQLLDAVSSSPDKIHVVQVACGYPMFGNQLFGHFISVVSNDKNANTMQIAGSLAPFGIYETPFAEVDASEFIRFAEFSNELMSRFKRNLNVNLQDRSDLPGINVISVDIKSVRTQGLEPRTRRV